MKARLVERIRRSIARTRSPVVLRSELGKLGGCPSQLSRALKALQEQGVLVRMGAGVYAKTRRSSVTGAIVPAGSLETLATEALRKLGVVVQPGAAARDYNSGKTTQVPGRFVVNTGKRRITRMLEVGGRRVEYETERS